MKKSDFFISVIIPVFNCEKYIEECINSVLNQTYKNIEIIVLNDGSKDNTLRILNNFGAKIKLINQENKGIIYALSNAINHSKAEWLAFIDADDLWFSLKLEKQVEYLIQRKELDACFTMLEQFISPELNPEDQANLFSPSTPQKGFLRSSMLIKKNIYLNISSRINPDHIAAEWVEWFSCAKELNLNYDCLNEVLVSRRLSPGSYSQNKLYNQTLIKIIKSNLDRKKGNNTIK